MSNREKAEYAREEVKRIIKETFDGIIEMEFTARLMKQFPSMFRLNASDRTALRFYKWLEVEYADCM